MRSGEATPVVRIDATVLDAVKEITKKKIGMTAIDDEPDKDKGIFTEGDLRRLIERVGDIRPLKIRDVMTPNPTTIQPQALAAEAAKILNSTLRNQLLVVDDNDRLIGAIHIHDLMTAKVI